MKHHILTVTALVTVLLASCSNEDELSQISYPADNVVRITASVSESQTRAGYTSDNLSEFCISIENPNNARYCYGNNKVTKSGDVWTPATQMLWENLNQEVNIYAYAPYNSSYSETLYNATDFPASVSKDQTSASDKSDFLLYQFSGFKPNKDLNNGNVPIVFKHMLSQLNITFKFGTSFNSSALLSADPITEVKVGGTIPNYTCNFVRQSITCSTGSTATIKAGQTSFTAATSKSGNAKAFYSCILVPQTVDAGKLTIEVSVNINGNTKTYSYAYDKQLELKSGMSHSLELSIE